MICAIGSRIMDRGRIVAVASPAELIGRSQSPARLIVRTAPCLASTVVDALPGVIQAALGERGWILETRAPNRVLAELVRRIDEAGAQLLEVELRGPSLEDVFIELTGRPWSAGEPPRRGLVTALPNLNGWVRHLLLTIALNFASPQAIVYGYLVPVFFLVAFGSVFRADSPPLQAHMGQILTITILGGACFGLPTALVSEREQGVWRRYRLLPIPVAWLVLSAMIARVLIVASAVLIQIALARAVYGTPLPTQPGSAVLAFFFVTAAFLALGLLIAALADTVPAVQALGQCIFLPMIMIGGVGVPLTALPDWAQHVAGFMPGRYAVEVLQPCFDGRNGLPGAGFRLGALAVIGLAAGVAAARLFRWEAGARIGRPARLVGRGRLGRVDIGRRCRLANGPPETGLARSGSVDEYHGGANRGNPFRRSAGRPRSGRAPGSSHSGPGAGQEFAAKLDLWPQGKLDDSGQSIRNLVSHRRGGRSLCRSARVGDCPAGVPANQQRVSNPPWRVRLSPGSSSVPKMAWRSRRLPNWGSSGILPNGWFASAASSTRRSIWAGCSGRSRTDARWDNGGSSLA